MKAFAIVVAPADYTLDLIRNIYIPRGVDWCFINNSSKASNDHGELTLRPILSEMGSVARLRFLWRMLWSYDAFVVNGWTQRPNVELLLLNWLFARKPMAWESDTELSVPMHPIKRLFKWLWLGLIFKRSFCYGFSGGTYAHKDLFRHYGMSESRIVLAPMMVDNAKCARMTPFDFGWMTKARPFRFFTLCRLVKIKQVDKVIAAFKLAKMDNAELHIIGTGDKLEEIRQQAADDVRIVVHGAVFGDDKIRLMQTMDCMVLYSSTEPWGLVVNESLAAGIPCIVSDRVGARRDLIEGKGNGLIVDYSNVNALAGAMQKVVSDFDWYKSASRLAEKTMSKWDYRFYAKKFDSWLNLIGREHT